MAHFLLAEPTISDAVMDAYYASHETAYGPASNLFLRQPKEVWETADVTGTIELRFDLGPTSPDYDFVALMFSNASSAATITWDGSTSSTFTASDWTSGSLTFQTAGQSNRVRTHNFYQVPTTRTERYVRFRISDASNSEGVFRAGRLYVAKSYQPTANVQVGLGFGFEDTSDETLTSAGERITRPNEPLPYLTFALQAWGDTAEDEFYDNLHEVMRLRGASKDVVAVIDPANPTRAGAMLYYGSLQSRQQIQIAGFQLYEAAFELRGFI